MDQKCGISDAETDAKLSLELEFSSEAAGQGFGADEEGERRSNGGCLCSDCGAVAVWCAARSRCSGGVLAAAVVGDGSDSIQDEASADCVEEEACS